MKSADDDWEELTLSTFCDASFCTRCFGRYKVKLTGIKRQFFLDRVRKSTAGTSEHEFYRVRINRVETRRQSDAACQGSTGCLSLATSAS